MAAFERALNASPDDLELRWLLNVAAMTIGKYPAGVPAKYLIPPDRFASTEDPGLFKDMAPELGLDHTSRAGGVVMDDFNGDGLPDIVISSVDPCEPLHLYLQQRDGRFKEARQAAGLVVGNATPMIAQMPMLEPFASKSLQVLLRFARWDEVLALPAPDAFAAA